MCTLVWLDEDLSPDAFQSRSFACRCARSLRGVCDHGETQSLPVTDCSHSAQVLEEPDEEWKRGNSRLSGLSVATRITAPTQ